MLYKKLMYASLKSANTGRYKILIVLLLFFTLQVYSQIPVGSWRNHFNYSYGKQIEIVKDRIYCLTEGGLFYYLPKNKTKKIISKLQSLTEHKIEYIKYIPSFDLLLLVYESANIDMIKDKKIYNIPDITYAHIKNAKVKSIEYIDNDAYIAFNFGVIVLNLEKKEIKDSYFFTDYYEEIEIFDIAYDNNQFIYLATNKGIYMGDINISNLADISTWRLDTTLSNSSDGFNLICVFNTDIYTNRMGDKDSLYVKKDTIWTLADNQYNNVKSIESGTEYLTICADNKILLMDDKQNIIFDYYYGGTPVNAKQEESLLWIADSTQSLIELSLTKQMRQIQINAPSYIQYEKLRYLNNSLFAISPKNRILSYFINEKWQNDTLSETEKITDVSYIQNKQYILTVGLGIVEIQNNEQIKKWDHTNTPLQLEINNKLNIAAMTTDKNKNLWITNSNTSSPIVVKTFDDQWYAYRYNNLLDNDHLGEIIATTTNQKWIILNEGSELFIFNDNYTLENEQDDNYLKTRLIGEGGRIITAKITCLKEDKTGVLWVGTQQGVMVYYDPYNILTAEGTHAGKIKISLKDGTASYLLETEEITAIAIDGANRKWLGTKKNGLFLISSEGSEQIYHYHTLNSLLPSNYIKSLEINGLTGELFIATYEGMLSYRSNAIAPKQNYDNIYAFPNPVRENYEGVISITGLKENTNIKITDINGNLIYETVSLGGQVSWNGKDKSGEKITSGIYIVFASDGFGEAKIATKIAFIN